MDYGEKKALRRTKTRSAHVHSLLNNTGDHRYSRVTVLDGPGGYCKTSLIRVIPAQVGSFRQVGLAVASGNMPEVIQPPLVFKDPDPDSEPQRTTELPASLDKVKSASGVRALSGLGQFCDPVEVVKIYLDMRPKIEPFYEPQDERYTSPRCASVGRRFNDPNQISCLSVLYTTGDYGQLWLSKLGRQRLISTRVREQVIHMTRGDTGKIVHNNTQINDHIMHQHPSVDSFLEEVEFNQFETEIRENLQNDQHHQRRLERLA
ncbi:hypothetical protein J6590_090985 [Homalodisca vitripennis]|nr:hypothetical protein J6590_090985 [Homalodisca vitripennis]